MNSYLELTNETEMRWEHNRYRKYQKVWCKHCHNYKWLRVDNIKAQKSCGCLAKGYRARYLFLKKGK